jgi:hypothetical protein
MKNLLAVFLFFFGLVLMNTPVFSQHYFDTGAILVRTDDYGAVRVYTIAGTDTIPHFDRVSILVSGNENEVMDYWNDIDIAEDVVFADSSEKFPYGTTGAFNNNYSGLPPNVLVKEHIYGWADAPYIIFEFTVTNKEATLLNSSIGLDIIPGVDDTYEDDTIRFNADNRTLYIYDQTWIGFKILNAATLSAHIFEWYEDYETSDENYYGWITGGVKDSALYGTDEDGAVAILSANPYALNPEDSVTVYFAMALGEDEASMLEAMTEAESKYTVITSVKREDILPGSFSLEQNYPNPFNPATKITFDIPSKENVTLKVFNILGQEVTTLVNNELDAGRYTVDFNASSLASGMYIYKITAGNYQDSKKMTLIK